MNTMFRVQGSRFRVQGSLCEPQILPVAPNLGLATLNTEHGTRNTERAAFGVVLAAAMLFIPVAALPQAITDPTRPPAELAVKAPAIEGAASPVHQLQSVIISPKRRAAIINGVVVELGGKYGDAVLAKVSEDEVVLKSDTSREVLKLYPAVDKTKAGKRARGKR